jgi:hypothetical protein
MLRSLIISISVAASLSCAAQTIERSYSGTWGDTWWKFDFRKDGTFTRTPRGHYGNSPMSGRYAIKGDTIRILEGYAESDGTITRYYLLDGDSCIIDTDLRYDYCVVNVTDETIVIPHSRIRSIKYPQVPARHPSLKSELDSVLNLTLNGPELKAYYPPDEGRTVIIADYYVLTAASPANISVNGKQPVFMPKDKIESRFYIEFTDINLGADYATVHLEMYGAGVKAYAYLKKENGSWALAYSTVSKK